MFFTVSLSKDEQRLSFHMNPALRGILIFFFISIMLMFLFAFTENDFLQASLLGKINLVILPLFLFLGSLYKYSIVFNKQSMAIEIYHGFLFLYKTDIFKLEDLNAIVKRHVRIRSFNRGGQESKITAYQRDRYIFGFIIKGKMIIIDRNCKTLKTRQYYMSLTSFLPFNVTEQT